MENNNLEHALRYLDRGWSVIPIQPRSKIPALKSWTTYQTQRPTKDQVTEWWTKMPEAGIAVVCGEISGIIIVDIDNKPDHPADTTNLELPPTLSQQTGSGGSHLIYAYRKGLIAQPKVAIRQGVDIRSDKSYAILPPSTHPNGEQYEWHIDDTIPLAPAPAWLEEKNQPQEKKDWHKTLTTQNTTGSRNQTAASVAGKLIHDMSPDVWDSLGFPALQAWNVQNNIPPLPQKELQSVWESIKKKHTKDNPTVDNMPPEVTEELIIETFKKNKTTGTYLLAKYMVNKYNIITIGERERDMYIYQDGYYKNGGDNLIIYPEMQRVLGDLVTKSAKTETYHKIVDMTSKPRSVFFETPNRFIPLKNGVYDFETDTLLPHDPKYMFVYQFPVVYNKEATCPLTEAFFNDVLNPEQKTLIEEWIGYYFWRNYQFKKAIIFVGQGDTGKTTLLEVITYLLGRENISSISLQKMSFDKFSAAHLYLKHGNLVDELSAKDITDTGAFKMATGGGSVTGEYKYGNQFSFINFAKFTFACNRIPDVGDMNDEAYFNRWMVVRFENPITNIIPNFIHTITTDEERSGLFNLAMKGLRRALLQRRFSYVNNPMQTKQEMMRSGSSIAMFASDMLVQDARAEIDKEVMYEAYVAYCQRHNLSVQTKDMLGKRLSDMCTFISDGLSQIDSKKTRVWRNAQIRATENREQEQAMQQEAEEAFNNL